MDRKMPIWATFSRVYLEDLEEGNAGADEYVDSVVCWIVDGHAK